MISCSLRRRPRPSVILKKYCETGRQSSTELNHLTLCNRGRGFVRSAMHGGVHTYNARCDEACHALKSHSPFSHLGLSVKRRPPMRGLWYCRTRSCCTYGTRSGKARCCVYCSRCRAVAERGCCTVVVADQMIQLTHRSSGSRLSCPPRTLSRSGKCSCTECTARSSASA